MCDGADHRSGRTSRARPPLPGSGKASCSPGECRKTKIAEGKVILPFTLSPAPHPPPSSRGRAAPVRGNGSGCPGCCIPLPQGRRPIPASARRHGRPSFARACCRFGFHSFPSARSITQQPRTCGPVRQRLTRRLLTDADNADGAPNALPRSAQTPCV